MVRLAKYHLQIMWQESLVCVPACLCTAKELCKDLIILPYEFDEYARISEVVYCILYKFADEVEVVSCDEAYISLQGCLPGQGDSCTSVNTKRRVHLFLQRIQTEIHEAPVARRPSGVATSLVQATSYAKKRNGPNSSHVMICDDPDQESRDVAEFISQLPITCMPTIGWRRRKIMENGLKICKDILHWSEKELCKLFFGEHVGKSLYEGIRVLGKIRWNLFFACRNLLARLLITQYDLKLKNVFSM